MARVTVIYDACVLYPAPLRDLLIQLATANRFRARWTDQIHDEWTSNLLEKRPELAEAVTRTRALMDEAVPDCLVTGYQEIIPTITLPDANDRHVVAAAIIGQASAIITFNLQDFPEDALLKYNLEAIHPDDFIIQQLDIEPADVLVAAQECLARLQKPPQTASEYLDRLRRQSLPKTVAALRPYESVLSPKPSLANYMPPDDENR